MKKWKLEFYDFSTGIRTNSENNEVRLLLGYHCCNSAFLKGTPEESLTKIFLTNEPKI